MIVTQHPPLIHSLFNPCLVKVTQGTETKAEIRVSNNDDYGNYTILTREYFAGKATFDIKKVLRSLMIDRITPIDTTPCWIDKNLFIEYTVRNADMDVIYQATAIFSVAQIQESSNYSDKRARFLTAFDRIKKYNGYPVELVVLAFREGNTYIRYGGEDFTQVDANVFVLPLPLSESSFSVTVCNYEFESVPIQEDYKQFIMPIENPIMPENPFYIRWINRQGGYDYWMFSYRQYLTRSISNQQTFNPYVENQETADSFEELYDLSANESVRVGTEGLNANDYDCVSKLIYSPKIEHYNPETMKWSRIFVEKGDNELDTRSILNQLEFTFKLPTVQLQF